MKPIIMLYMGNLRTHGSKVLFSHFYRYKRKNSFPFMTWANDCSGIRLGALFKEETGTSEIGLRAGTKGIKVYEKTLPNLEDTKKTIQRFGTD